MFKRIKRYFKFRKIEKLLTKGWLWQCKVRLEWVQIEFPWWFIHIASNIKFDEFIKLFIKTEALNHWYEMECPEDIDWKIDYCIDVLEYSITHPYIEQDPREIYKTLYKWFDEEKMKAILEHEDAIDKIKQSMLKEKEDLDSKKE